ncbi:MAG TPA: LamG-like jellyroll fold domain-containing protein [Dehalococcoidia bacterium]|nr:LamG-like jellyroll fold domain-containing protein [Dehalococcoidia bacterium]
MPLTRSLVRSLTRPLAVPVGSDPEAALLTPDQVSGLALWLEARFITGLADGAAVASWPDAGPNGYTASQATGASQPVFRQGQLGGYSAVSFNGSSQYLALSGAGLGLLNGVGGVTLFIVCQSAASGSLQQAFSASTPGASTQRLSAGLNSSGVQQVAGRHQDADGLVTVTGGTVTTGAWCVLTTRIDYLAATAQLYVNGSGAGSAAFGSAGAVQATSSAAIAIGALCNGVANFWNGSLAAVILYTRALNTSERSQLEQSLGQQYGISIAAA